jgi:CHAT domain-containing protein/Tfp pilus assembly protein PilF
MAHSNSSYLIRAVCCSPASRKSLFTIPFFLIISASPFANNSQPRPETQTRVAATAERTPANLTSNEGPVNQQSTFEIDLLSRQFVHIVLGRDPDSRIVVNVSAPNGQNISTVLARRYGDLSIIFLADASGRYRLSVEAREKQPPQQPYHWTIKEQRTATARDRAAVDAMRLLNNAEELRATWTEQNLRRAADLYEQTAAQLQAANLRAQATIALGSCGEIHFMLSDYASASEFFRRALVAATAIKDREAEIDSLNNLGYVHVYLSEYRSALPYFQKALKECQRLPPAERSSLRPSEARALNNIGEVYYSLGNPKKALDLFIRAMKLWTAAGDRRGQALAHLNLGYSYYDMGDTQAAADEYQKSLELWEAVDDRWGAALTRTAMGGVYDFLGDRQAALEAHEHALTVLTEIGDRQGQASAHNGIGRIYEESNENGTALDHYEQALRLFRDIRNRDFEALTECYVGRVYCSIRNLSKALNAYESARSISRRVGNRRFEAHALNGIASVYAADGKHELALAQYAQMLQLYRQFADRRGQARALNSIGQVFETKDEPHIALTYYRKALTLNLSGKDLAGEAATRYRIARAASSCNLLLDSLSEIKNSIDIVETLRSHMANYELRTSYFALMHEYYGFYVDLLMRLHEVNSAGNYDALALETNESARARSLLEVLIEADTNLREGAPTDLLAQEESLRRKLSARGNYQLRLMNERTNQNQINEIEKEIRRLTDEYQDIEARIRAHSPRFVEATGSKTIRVEEIQRELLDEHTVLLEYALGNDRSYLWLVTPNSLESFQLPPRSTLEETARDVYKLLTARQPVAGESPEIYQQRIAEADGMYWQKASLLSQMLLGPVAQKISGKRLLVVSDGALQYVPFESLPTPAIVNDIASAGAADPKPLFLSQEIISEPSASTLWYLRTNKTASSASDKVVEVFADPVFEPDDPRLNAVGRAREVTAARDVPGPTKPGDTGQWRGGSAIQRLPGTLREGRAIIATVPAGEGKLASGFDASRSEAMSNLSSYKIVHFATHGVINSEHPELSGIVLSMIDKDGQPENGFLQLHDIYGLRLTSQLVVLSACSTALGKDVKGEGLIGLTRGFMYAGSRSTIASLWKVDDEATAELMSEFYGVLLRDGATPAAALRQAKQAMWERKQWHQPFYWAAFVLQGEYNEPIHIRRAQRLNPATIVFLIGGVLAGAVMGCYVWRLVRRRSMNHQT